MLKIDRHELGMGKNQGAAAGLLKQSGLSRLGERQGILFSPDQFLVEIDGIMFRRSISM
jgi:hypothetical protein